ncbi:hypothetical protein RND81_07G043700 [Saponaria officinalis]|uniref:Reverse transcriptase zinc-binding domain-containing protein n=1 Tax=Saponaria officinalis TaxID=3572 RepID=A0AAW1JMB2_SAPOF
MGGRMSIKHYDALMDKIFKAVNHWSFTLISHAGKILLLNSVIVGTLIYWCSAFLLPKTLVSKINSVCSNFYWGDTHDLRHIHWLNLARFTKPREAGGKLKEGTSCGSVWARCYILRGGDPWLVRSRAGDPRGWKDLLSIKDVFIEAVGGVNVAMRFLDTWSSEKTFCTTKAYAFFAGWTVAPRKMVCIWESLAVPKHRIVCWTAYLKRLATIDLLQHRGFEFVNRCVLCCSDCESHEHLFFACSYASSVWSSILAWFGLTRRPWSLSRELEWVFSHCKTKTPIHRAFRAALLATVYHVWKERNARVFQDHSMEVDMLSRRIKFDVCCRIYGSIPCSLRNDLCFLLG